MWLNGGGPRDKPRRAVADAMQILFQPKGTDEQYRTRNEWNTIRPPPCKWCQPGRCQLAFHGTYLRKRPKGIRIRRFRCRKTGRTISMLPIFMAARMMGTLQEAEEATVRLEAVQAKKRKRPNWRALRKRASVAATSQWSRRRARGVWEFLKKLPGLHPQECEGLTATVTAYRAAWGTQRVLRRCRKIAERELYDLPAPVAGFVGA